MKSFLIGTSTGTPSAGAANYVPFVFTSANNWSNAINSGFEQPLPHAITLDNFRVKIATAPGATKNNVFTVYKNGVATALTVTINGTNTTGQDLTHSVSFAAGDLITLQMTPDATATLPGTVWWTARQDATGLTALLGTANTTLTGQFAIMGYSTGTLTTGDAGIIVPTAGTISNLYVISSASAANFTVYKNGAAQTLTTGAMAGTTANDTTHNFSVVAGDRISIANGGTGRASSWGVSFAPTTDGQSFIGHIGSGNAPTTGTQYYQPLGVGTASWNATETAVQVMLQASTIQAIYSQTAVSPGLSPKAYAFTVRQNAANTTATDTVNDASATPNDGSGRASNLTGQSVTVADDDMIDIAVTATSTPTGLHAYNSILLSVSSGGGGGTTAHNLMLMGVGS